jgi:hypothetical protein
VHRLVLLTLALVASARCGGAAGEAPTARVGPDDDVGPARGFPYRVLVHAITEAEGPGRTAAEIEELRRRLCRTHAHEAVVYYHAIRSRRWHHLWLCSRETVHGTTDAGARQLQAWLEWLRAEHRTMLQGCSPGGDWLVWQTVHASGVRAAVYCDGRVVLSLPGGARFEGYFPASGEPTADRDLRPLAVDVRALFPLHAPDDEPAARRERPAERASEPLEADTFRLVLSPIGRVGRARFSWTMSDFLLHQLDYSLSEHWQLGLQAIRPVIYVGLFPQARYVRELTESLAVGFQVTGGVFWPYVELDLLKSQFTHRFFLYGGGAFVTLKTRALVLNLGLPLYGLHDGQREYRYEVDDATKQVKELSRTYYDERFYAVPSLGASWRVARRIKLSLEAHLPLGSFDSVGKVWALLYGMRVLGQGVYFDINFLAPLFPGMADLYRTIPLGIPFVSFGLAR